MQCRHWGWQIFQAIERHCKVETGGYATVRDVDVLPVTHEDRMETFFLVSALVYKARLSAERGFSAERDTQIPLLAVL